MPNAQVKGGCPLCGDLGSVSHVAHCGEYELLLCLDCRLRFSSPMVEPGAGFYNRCSLYENRSAGSHGDFSEYDWRFRTWAKLVQLPPGSRLLDIGCGDGGFLSFARKRALDVYGLDLDERAVDAARRVRGLEKVNCGLWQDIETMEGWKEFDAITMFDVLEHLGSPAAALRTVSLSLKANGVFCTTVPRLDRFPRIFDVEADFPPHHFTLWTDTALTSALTRAGLKDIAIVRKPLILEDVLAHLVWRARRIKQRSERVPESTPRPLAVAKPDPFRNVMKALVLNLLRPANWLLRTFAVGRGHTLLALAWKREQRERVRRDV